MNAIELLLQYNNNIGGADFMLSDDELALRRDILAAVEQLRATQVWYSNQFTGMYPVPVCAIAVAASREEATDLINEQLLRQGFDGDAKAADTQQFDTSSKTAIVVNDGDY
jgi:hypothetical protein